MFTSIDTELALGTLARIIQNRKKTIQKLKENKLSQVKRVDNKLLYHNLEFEKVSNIGFVYRIYICESDINAKAFEAIINLPPVITTNNGRLTYMPMLKTSPTNNKRYIILSILKIAPDYV